MLSITLILTKIKVEHGGEFEPKKYVKFFIHETCTILGEGGGAMFLGVPMMRYF